jgi:thiol-disulfide isomerase/thioredoxin
MRNLVIIASLAFMAWWWHGHRPVKEVPVRMLASMDSCHLKKSCAIIYVAPWCGACKQLLPQLTPFFENALKNDQYGIQVVVGAGKSDEDNQREADALGPIAIVDNDKSIARNLQVKYFPSIYVVNSSQKILLRDQDALFWIQKHFK